MAALHSQTTTHPRGPGARTRALDTAEGVLIGIRRIGTANAFDELVTAARRHGVSVFTLAEALVALAGENELPEPTAARAARAEWGALFWP
ncbi:MAG: ANTAR domain-containing protein [Comamonadaceae bacterium]|nr:MAG: ANTAR domain-containing protein [Comamonadaceae bacterium]